MADVKSSDAVWSELGKFNREITWPGRDFEHSGPGQKMSDDPSGFGLEIRGKFSGVPRVPGRQHSLHGGALVGSLDRHRGGTHDLSFTSSLSYLLRYL